MRVGFVTESLSANAAIYGVDPEIFHEALLCVPLQRCRHLRMNNSKF